MNRFYDYDDTNRNEKKKERVREIKLYNYELVLGIFLRYLLLSLSCAFLSVGLAIRCTWRYRRAVNNFTINERLARATGINLLAQIKRSRLDTRAFVSAICRTNETERKARGGRLYTRVHARN